MKIIKILSDRIQIKTDQFEFKNIRINDLISITDRQIELITMVVSVSDLDNSSSLGEDDYISNVQSIKTIECAILGSVKNGSFVKAIDRYPTMDIEAVEVSSEIFCKMIHSGNGFHIGQYVAYRCPAYVDGNRFFQRHSCIVGNTGSGKSETTARILQEAAKLKSTNIIVFDIHGEYSKLSYARNIKIGKDFHFPIWFFGFSGMISNLLKIKDETATVVLSALRKCYYSICPDGKENKPVYFNYNELILQMKELNNQLIPTGEYYKSGDKAGMAKTTKGDYNGKLSGAINILEDKKMDSRYTFLFGDEAQEYLYEVIRLIMNNDKPVKNIDLSEIPHDVAIPIIGVITKLVYEIQRTYKVSEVHPVTLVCDEAHVYIPNNFQLSASEKRLVEIFEDIAKEGRKFGVSLLVASQRPSELNKTIMAQCANFIVGKLNNENDKSMIKGMLPDGNESVIDSTTMFSPGDVLVIGDAVPIPLKIHVEFAKERPNSRTIDFWDIWNKGVVMDTEIRIERYLEN